MAGWLARRNVRLLMTPGPVEVSPRVLAALSSPQIYHYYPGFIDFFEDTVEKVKRVFQTKQDVILMQGEGVLGLEAAVANIIDPGDKVLVCDSGPFGKWFRVYVENYGGVAVEASVDPREVMDVELVKRVMDDHKDLKALTIVHCETPCGTLNPVGEICREAKKRGLITIVDAVASLGGVEVKPDDWGIDVCISASQKCISSTAGLTLMTVSQNAWQAMEAKKKPLRNSYLSILDYRETWLKQKRFPFTPLVAEVYALNEAVSELLEEGLEQSFKRHREAAELCRRYSREIGLTLWPKKDEYASNTVTAVEVPTQYSDKTIVEHMAEKYGVLIGGGYGETKGRVLRVGHMGYQATTANIITTMEALRLTLRDLS
ncbi:MAG: alanine--glyoxylate aminotransferase family protein [Nitrososphaerales archaeon]